MSRSVNVLGIVEHIELDADLLAGESRVSVLAERYEVSVRTIERRKTWLRNRGRRVRAPSGEETGSLGGGSRGQFRGGPWSWGST